MTPEEYAEYDLRRQKIASLEAVVLAAAIAINGIVENCAGGRTSLTDLFDKLHNIHVQRFGTIHLTRELP